MGKRRAFFCLFCFVLFCFVFLSLFLSFLFLFLPFFPSLLLICVGLAAKFELFSAVFPPKPVTCLYFYQSLAVIYKKDAIRRRDKESKKVSADLHD